MNKYERQTTILLQEWFKYMFGCHCMCCWRLPALLSWMR